VSPSPTKRVFPAVPLPIGGGRILPSPSQFYLTGEDRLQIVSACSVAGITIHISARIADASGDTIPESWVHNPSSDRALRFQQFDIGEGSLLNVVVVAQGGTVLAGQAYVTIQLIRGVGAAATLLGTLLAGYVTTIRGLGFPGSPIENSLEGYGAYRRISGTTPGAGAELLETVPTGARWQLLAVNASLTTSATVINRTPNLYLDQAGVTYFASGQPVAAGPGVTTAYWWAVGMPLAVQVGLIGSMAGIFEPNRMIAGSRFFTNTSNLQPGDQWGTPSYLVQEWLEVP
jgi:hypothetical protein